LAGKYLARVLSFKATSFDITPTGFDKLFTTQYDKATVSGSSGSGNTTTSSSSGSSSRRRRC